MFQLGNWGHGTGKEARFTLSLCDMGDPDSKACKYGIGEKFVE